MSSAEGYVLPKPGIPKTLGILNVIFGVVLVLYGLCTLGTTLLMPMFSQVMEDAVKKGQATAKDQRAAQIKDLDDRIAAAKTDEEKKPLEDQKATLVNAPAAPEVDVTAMTDMYKNPTIMGYAAAQAGTGVVMNIALIVAGIGLIRLRSWGRKLGLWLAGIQIVRLGLLTAISIIVVQPVTVEATTKMLTKIEEQAKAQGKGQAPAGPGNPAQSVEMAKMMAGMGSIFAILYFVGGSIYPIVTLILLNGAGAKAACQPKKISETPEFLS